LFETKPRQERPKDDPQEETVNSDDDFEIDELI
jgi:hypothetical protein